MYGLVWQTSCYFGIQRLGPNPGVRPGYFFLLQVYSNTPIFSLLLSRPLIKLVFFIERWVLSALFLFLAYEYIDTLKLMRLFSESGSVLPAAMVARDHGLSDGVHFEDYARYTMLAVSNGVCGVLLLISRKPSRYPTHPQEILVPLAATFGYMLFNNHVSVPEWMSTPLVPDSWQTPGAAAGVVFSSFGALFAFNAILWLGRSLGIVVSVREVVLGGPYRYVRHPIYLGYAFIMAGMFLTSFTPRMAIMVVAAMALLIWRARLEEHVLSAHSAAYREWMKHTGFLWPNTHPAPVTLRAADPAHADVGN